jgi:hypothetical protein
MGLTTTMAGIARRRADPAHRQAEFDTLFARLGVTPEQIHGGDPVAMVRAAAIIGIASAPMPIATGVISGPAQARQRRDDRRGRSRRPPRAQPSVVAGAA